MPSEVGLCLYRVAQEALRNLEKHSGVQQARLGLDHRDHAFELVIEDHGVGFESARVAQEGGLGFTSIKERIGLVNGDLQINSAPGRGTLIRVRIPDQSIPAQAAPVKMSSAATG